MAKNMFKAAGLLLLINGCVKVLGFVREMVIADGFGASAYTDAYLAAYTLPYFLQSVLGYAFVSAVLPALSRYWKEDGDNREACRIGSTLINVVAAGMLLISFLGMIASPLLVWLTAPELPADTAALAADLAVIIFPSALFMSVGMVISGILNSRYRFVAAAVAPGLSSIAIILSAGVFAHGRIEVVAWGTLVGFVAFFLITLADLPKTGFRYTFSWDLKHPAVRGVLKDILPIILGLAVNQIYTIVNRIFASGLAEGSISALNYANKLINLPQGVFVAAIITVAFPALAEHAAAKDMTELRATVKRGLSMILLVALPAACGLMLLDTPIIQLLFERGEFDAEATRITAIALMWMCPGLVFQSATMLLVRVYYARENVRLPLLASGISVLVNILLSFLFTPLLDHGALGLANSGAAAVNALLLWYFLERSIGFTDSRCLRELGRICLASLIMCLPVFACAALIRGPLQHVSLVVTLAAAIGLAVVIYFAALKILGSVTLGELLSGIKRKSR